MRFQYFALIIFASLCFTSCGGSDSAQESAKNSANQISSGQSEGAAQQSPANSQQPASKSKVNSEGVKETYSESAGKVVKHTMNGGKAFKLGTQYAEDFCTCYNKTKKAADCEKSILTKIESIKKNNDPAITKYLDKAYASGKKVCL